MTLTTDQVLARRRMLLVSFLVGWSAWYGFLFLQETGLRDLWGPMVNITVGVIGMVGWLMFAVAMVQIFRVKKKYKNDPAALAALNDEMMHQNQSKATVVSFYTMILLQVVLVLVGNNWDLTSANTAHLTIFAGVFAMMASFLWFDWRD